MTRPRILRCPQPSEDPYWWQNQTDHQLSENCPKVFSYVPIAAFQQESLHLNKANQMHTRKPVKKFINCLNVFLG